MRKKKANGWRKIHARTLYTRDADAHPKLAVCNLRQTGRAINGQQQLVVIPPSLPHY